MPIVITPQGEYIDSVTGNPVGMPPQRPDIPRGDGVVSDRELDMREGMMPQMQMDMDDIDKVRLLMDMGLIEQDAIEAVVREKGMGTVRPEEFGGQQMPTQQQQAPMPRPQMPTSPQAMGALPSAPPQRPFDLSGMSREQVDMVRRGIDPFAEGMVR